MKRNLHLSPASSNTGRLPRAVIISNMSLFEEKKREQHGWVGKMPFLTTPPSQRLLHTHTGQECQSARQSRRIGGGVSSERNSVLVDPPLTRQAGRQAGAGLSAVAMDTVNGSLSSPLVWLCSAYRHGAERAHTPPPLPPPTPPSSSSAPSAFCMPPI